MPDVSPADIRTLYQQDGYCFPFTVMTQELAATYRAKVENLEAQTVANPQHRALWYGNSSFVVPFVDEITRLEAILAPVRAVLGPDVILWRASFFSKEPHSQHFVSWHQDLTYWGLNQTDEVTAWLALTDVTVENGCMRFLPGSHTRDIVEHRDTFAEVNMLSRGQELAVEVDEAKAVNVLLEAGQMSIHHGRLFHASHANTSNNNRIGLAIRYILPSMQQVSGEKAYARLVCGEDKHGNFHLLPRPRGVLHPADIEVVRRNDEIQHKFFYANAENPNPDPR